MYLSVVICTFNPSLTTLHKVLDALKSQNLPASYWELLLIDNNSSTFLGDLVDLSWHPNGKVIREERPGLSYARVKGVSSSNSELIVFVDDDNILAPDYLENSFSFFKAHAEVGCFGGKSLPVFESEPPSWFKETGINLGCQDYGEEFHISNFATLNFNITAYPDKAPIGTGMVILKKAFLTYLKEVETNPERMKLGRNGKSLSSGEDNDIILSIVKNGYEIAYHPALVVHHLIPAKRYSLEYLGKMAFESNKSWIKVLSLHGICPWRRIRKWTYPIRKAKSYLSHRAWQSPLSSIKWKGSCGLYKGLSEL
jgi:glycosyltransferase involved in cell wall biosynthesis